MKTSKKSGIAAIGLREDDELISVNLIKDEDVIIITEQGMAIHFNSLEIGASGRTTIGLKGITLKEDDKVVSTLVVRDTKDDIAVFAENGLGKKFSLNELPIQKRAGKGLICYKTSDISGPVVAASLVNDEDNVLVCGDRTSICIKADEIPLLGRTAVGNQIIKNSNIISVSKV